jgi:hypothetical protein
MSYDVRGHVLLNATAKALQPEQLVALGLIAEDALGLTGTAYTGTKATRAASAVVRQVNLMAVEPENPYLASHSRGEEAKSWDFAAISDKSRLDPYAVAIVAALAAEAGAEADEYTTVPGFR